MDFIIYMIPIGFVISMVIGYFAVKNRWKVIDFF